MAEIQEYNREEIINKINHYQKAKYTYNAESMQINVIIDKLVELDTALQSEIEFMDHRIFQEKSKLDENIDVELANFKMTWFFKLKKNSSVIYDKIINYLINSKEI